MFNIRKATRQQSKLRIGLSGTSGSGKTYSALQLAYGLCGSWEKIVLIDTENGSGDLYSDLGPYNIITLVPPFSPERYIDAIKACEEAGMEVIIIDSISHEWEGKGGCLEINETIASTRFKGNSWSAWSVTTPRHQKFIEKIIQSKCDIITTVRNKVDMAIIDNKPKKVGTKEITREGFEYELTLNLNIERDSHLATASKDRTGLFIDRDPFIISSKTGEEIKEWNLKGEVGKSYAEIVEEEKLKEVQEKKTNEKVKPLPEATNIQTERFLQFQASYDSCDTLEEIKKVGERLKNQIATDKTYVTKGQLEIIVQVKQKKEEEINKKLENQKKEEVKPITPPIEEQKATVEVVKPKSKAKVSTEEVEKQTAEVVIIDEKVKDEEEPKKEDELSEEDVKGIF